MARKPTGEDPVSRPGEPRLEIVFQTHEGPITKPLPRSGSVVLGRGDDVDIQVPNPSVSRRHAILYIGPPLRIEDLGSSNGTRITRPGAAAGTDQLIEVPRRSATGSRDRSVTFSPGNLLHLGATQAVVRHRPDPDDGTPAEGPRSGVIVQDPALCSVYETAERIAKSSLNVLVLGETGVGKEILAATIHRASPRAGRAYLCLNCAALAEPLLESELFGHERGASTGAHKPKAGLLETAEGGTVFLDEVGELSLATQAKLLRVLEDQTVTRVGGLKPKRIDVRFIAATNRDLKAAIARGAFRGTCSFA